MFTPFNSLDNVYAHMKNNGEKEPFLAHVVRTEKYFDLLVEKHELLSVFKNLLLKFGLREWEKVYHLIREVVKFHDIGKLSKDFQNVLAAERMKVAHKVTHSDLSFYVIHVLINDLYKHSYVTKEERKFLILFSTVVNRHHSFLSDVRKLKFWDTSKERDIKYILSFIQLKSGVDELIEISRKIAEKCENRTKQLFEAYFCIEGFLLYKLLHSLLITSDFFATAEFMEGFSYEPRTITEEIISKLEENISMEREGNVNPEIDRNFQRLLKLSPSQIKDINTLRSAIAAHVEEKFMKNKNHSIFFLEIPTGGGKTNISLRIVEKVAKKKKKMFYVLPYINIIEQNYAYFQQFIPYDLITRYDHKYIAVSDFESALEKDFSIGYYDTLFLNYPFVFTTHIGFFDMFFRNGKSDNFNFYQLANSIVVLDEIQSYNPEYWNVIANLFSALGKYFNTTFVLMSATLPDLSKFIEEKNNKDIYNLTPNEFCKHPLFERVKIEFLSNNLEDHVFEKVQTQKNGKILIVVNTVNDSYIIYKSLCEQFPQTETYILNSTILSFRKKEIIDYIKKYNGHKTLILVSTQSIEAGVDLDFDVGYRALAPLDSIIQVAGRVNRNARISNAILHIFDDSKWKKVYSKDLRNKILELNLSSLKNGTLDIEEFYEKTINELEKQLRIPVIENKLNYFTNLEFEQIDKNMRLIETDTVRLFIPIDVELERIPELHQILIYCGAISKDEKILPGEKVWELYQSSNFNRQEFRIFSKVLELFIVNLYNYTVNNGIRLKNILKDEIQRGIYYASDYEEYYSIDSGLDVKKFTAKKFGSEYEFI